MREREREQRLRETWRGKEAEKKRVKETVRNILMLFGQITTVYLSHVDVTPMMGRINKVTGHEKGQGHLSSPIPLLYHPSQHCTG